MKIISKTIIPLFLAVILSSCNGNVAAIPTMSQVNIMGTAMSIAKTEVVMTLTAVPTATYPPPTIIPPDAYSNGHVSPPPVDKLDYAMVTAPKVYTLFPYINEASYYTGEYSGCATTYDFQNYVWYAVSLPLENVNIAFEKYFQSERWEFTEATSELVEYGINTVPRTTYDVYRISSKDTTAFERLKLVLTDDSARRGKNYVEVRTALTHIETKENFRYLTDFYCPSGGSWLWIRLEK